MTRRRLPWLLVLLGGLLLLRWLAPPPSDSDTSVVSAVDRRASSPMRMADASANVQPALSDAKNAAAHDEADGDSINNAFEVRANPLAVPAPPPLTPPTPMPEAASLIAPAVAPVTAASPPPEPLPALAVIGTWDDGNGPAVFIASAQGTQLARSGTVLLAEYRVTAITAQQVVLHALHSPRELTLAIPFVSASIPTAGPTSVTPSVPAFP